MATTFTAPPVWTNEGTAPSETLKTNGFQAGYKPPAPIFNYMFNKYGICLTELQTEVNKKSEVGKSLAGQTVSPTNGTSVVAGEGAEIFNDYRNRGTDETTNITDGNVASGDYSHAEGSGTTASGVCSHAEGSGTTASGNFSHAEGADTTASGDYSRAEGSGTTASGVCSHAEGSGTTASGNFSHAEGADTTASGNFSHAEGRATTASGACSHAEGAETTASGSGAHAEGFRTQAIGDESYASGTNTVANHYQFVIGKHNAARIGCTSDGDQSADHSLFIVGYGAPSKPANAFRITAAGKCMSASSFGSSGADYAEYFEWQDGNKNSEDRRGLFASGNFSHAEGRATTASGACSHAEGAETTASGSGAHAEGFRTQAIGDESYASGTNTVANHYQFVIGKHNAARIGCTSDGDQSADHSLFIVGYGAPSKPANAFRITAAGKCMSASSFGSSGADYAEYFEWQDGNKNSEDRRGLFVTLDGDKIRLANANDDYILGVISANPSVVGDVQSENWHGMYKKDVFGQPLTETVEVPENTDDKTGEVIPAHTITRLVVNPDYNPDEEYTSREFRKEWACVGLMGKLIIVDDGTCVVNGYCKVADGGKATKADTGYRVMKRLDDTHIQILYR